MNVFNKKQKRAADITRERLIPYKKIVSFEMQSKSGDSTFSIKRIKLSLKILLASITSQPLFSKRWNLWKLFV